MSYRVEVSLVELVHSSLELAALALPLLKVADRFHGGTLPRGGAGVVVHIVDPAPVIHSALPPGGVKTQTHTRKSLKTPGSAQRQKTMKTNEGQHDAEWMIVPDKASVLIFL